MTPLYKSLSNSQNQHNNSNDINSSSNNLEQNELNHTDLKIVKADLQAKEALIEKYQTDLELYEQKNSKLSRQISYLEEYAQFSSLDDLAASSVYRKVKDFLSVVISEKKCMESFLIEKIGGADYLNDVNISGLNERIKVYLLVIFLSY